MTSVPFPTALAFDWDNTLVESWTAIATAMNYMRRQMGVPEWTLDEVKANCTRAARESFPQWFGEDWKKAYDFYYEGMDEVRRNRPIVPLNGSENLLVWLKSSEIPAFVVSNKRGDYLRIDVEKSGWTDHFVAIVGAQDAPYDKPHRAHVDHALKHGDVTADSNVWFVGDSEADIQCAKNTGCTPVLIGTAAEAERLGAALSFQDCQGLLDWLKTHQAA